MNKISEIQDILKNNKIDGYLVSDINNLRYIFGYISDFGLGFITPESSYIITDSRYIFQAKIDAPFSEVIMSSYEKNESDIIRELIKSDEKKVIAYEPRYINVNDYNNIFDGLDIQLIDFEEQINNLRMIKTEDEILSIKKAEDITSEVFEEILEYIRPGVKDTDIAIEIEYRLKKKGASKTSFDTIVAVGENTCKPHAVLQNVKIKEEDIVLMDFGCIYNGYCSDMTRTIFVGNISDEMKSVYNIVNKAGEIARNIIKENVKCIDVDKSARDFIKKNGYGNNFKHSLGHSLGLFIHEKPVFSPSSKDVLKENMVLSVEPGIYLDGRFGIRIEDIIEVKKDGYINLTKARKDLIVL